MGPIVNEVHGQKAKAKVSGVLFDREQGEFVYETIGVYGEVTREMPADLESQEDQSVDFRLSQKAFIFLRI